jgi:hypothetical protein
MLLQAFAYQRAIARRPLIPCPFSPVGRRDAMWELQGDLILGRFKSTDTALGRELMNAPALLVCESPLSLQ